MKKIILTILATVGLLTNSYAQESKQLTNLPNTSSLTREQVKAEFLAAQKNGTLINHYESYDFEQSHKTNKSNTQAL